jgi:uncharacterized protein YggE
MRNNTSIFIWVGIGALVLVLCGIYFMHYHSEAVITADGEATVKAKPDVVSVYVLIETRNSSAELAQASNNVLFSSLVNRLGLLGFANESIQLTSYNVYPDYDWKDGTQTLKGYIVSQQLVLYMADFSKVSSVVDQVIGAGGLVSSINFELSSAKQNEYKTQLLEKASSDGRSKAEAIAAGLGKKLGRLVSVQVKDAYSYGPVPYYSRSDAGSSAEGQLAKDATPQKQAELNSNNKL